MKKKLTERMEIRLTPRMKKDAKKIGKRRDISIGEVMRLGLTELVLKEAIAADLQKQVAKRK